MCTTPLGIVTASRDKTIKIWKTNDDGTYGLSLTLAGHTDFVTALSYIPPGKVQLLPNGGLLSGSRDTTVLLWDAENPATPVAQLKGHQYQVTNVLLANTGEIISASLDSTIKIWRGADCIQTLTGHEGAVLSLLLLPSGDLLSGGGDTTIRVWHGMPGNMHCTAIIKAHSDSVRGLALFEEIHAVVSASHDMTLKIWTMSCESIAELVGHTAIVYCAASHGSVIGSGSEDDTVKLWHADGICLQTIEHPGNIWSLCFLENGDLVTACSDGVTRIWTSATDKVASSDIISAYEASIAAKKEAAAAHDGHAVPDGLQVKDPSVLQYPGTHDGQTVVVREGPSGVSIAYSWSAAQTTWEKIGEVVGGPSDTVVKTVHAGESWDFVFDVDIAEDSPPLKLALNAGENAYVVADRFLMEHNLPIAYREQIVQFILKNTEGALIGSGGGNGALDPFTGANAYVPSSSNMGRGVPSTVTGGGADPYTGTGYQKKQLPAKQFVLYDAPLNKEGVMKKILEFNTAVAAESALSQEETKRFDDDVGVVLKMLKWPLDFIFPALDTARIHVLKGGGDGQQLAEGVYTLLPAVCSVEASQACQLTALRFMSNLTTRAEMLHWVKAHAPSIIEMAAAAADSATAKKNVRQAVATLLHNMAFVLSRLPSDELEAKAQLIAAAIKLLKVTPSDEAETRVRALIAAGTPLDHSQMRALAKELGLGEVLEVSKTQGGEVAGAALEVSAIIL